MVSPTEAEAILDQLRSLRPARSPIAQAHQYAAGARPQKGRMPRALADHVET